MQETETFCPESRLQWRRWLQKNHDKKQSVWLIYYKLNSGKAVMSWSDAVDEALCFGWIDSTRRTLDEERFLQFFTRRKAGSTWSKVNKEKVKRLMEEDLIAPAGLESIERARQNGTWTLLDAVEGLKIPKDLDKEFKAHPGAKAYFMSLSKSVRKMLLQWLVLAKRPETRQKRVHEVARCAAKQQRPKQFS
jgi:uncharacterized protein YdeI (YjbR/CyaY-like superfamily)